jgi:putative peptidoglycan lipid II flippase
MRDFFHRKSKSISQAALVLAGFTFGAQLLSLIRDRLFASHVGAGLELDTYYYAFKIPDILYAIFSALVSLTVLIPLLSRHKKGETEEMKHTYSILFTVFCAGSALLILIVFILMPQLVHLIAPGVSDVGAISDIILYSRILLLQPFFLGISNLLGSYTQMKERFLLYACSPFIYNLATVLGLIFLYPTFGMAGVVSGVVVGSILHGLIQLPFIRKENFLPTFKRITRKELSLIKEVITQSIPRALILSLVQIEFLFLNSIASLMPEGNTSMLNLSNNLQSVPLSLIGVSLVIASFPSLSRNHATGDKVEFKKVFDKTLKTILLWATLATVGLFICKKYVIYIILGSQSFDPASLDIIVTTFGIFVLALIPQCVEMLITRAYYASGNTKRPALLNLFAAALTIALAYGLYSANTGTASVTILATAFSIGAWVSCVIFYFSVRKSLLKL